MRYAVVMVALMVLIIAVGCSKQAQNGATESGQVAGTAAKAAAPGPEQTQNGSSPLQEKAAGFIHELAQGNWSAAENLFSAQMKTALPADKLEATWTQVTRQYGAFVETLGAKQGMEQGYATVTVPCKFERATVNIKLVFDQSGLVGGMWFV